MHVENEIRCCNFRNKLITITRVESCSGKEINIPRKAIPSQRIDVRKLIMFPAICHPLLLNSCPGRLYKAFCIRYQCAGRLHKTDIRHSVSDISVQVGLIKRTVGLLYQISVCR
jgi:hypothetical protein